MINIKEILLDKGIVTNNKYLDMYIELINSNINTARALYTTQIHHIIPKCYFKAIGAPVDNSTNNKINLSHKDHILAHYYLYMCANELWFKKANSLAVMLNMKDNEFTYDSLDKLQELYEYAAQSIGKSKKGKKYVSKDNRVIMVDECEIEDYLSKGFIKGNSKLKNKITMTKDGEDVVVDSEYYEDYIAKGYIRGHSHKTSQITRNYRTIHKGDIQTRVNANDLDKYLSEGWSIGKPDSDKTKKGHPSPMKGKKGLPSSVKGFIWVNDGNCNKRIKPEGLEYYISIGYKKGMVARA